MFSRSLFRKEGIEIWGCSFVSDLKLRSTCSAEKNFADEITWITWKTDQNLEIWKIWTHFSSFAQVSSVRSVGFNRPVGWSRSISTDGSVAPTGRHGRYRRSVRLHLRRITVDINGRFGYTHGELRSISTVGSVHSTQKSVDIDHIGRLIQKKNRSTVEVDKHSKKCWYRVCVPILHNVNRWKQLSVNNFKRISRNNTHTHRDHDGHGQECVKIVFILTKLCL